MSPFWVVVLISLSLSQDLGAGRIVLQMFTPFSSSLCCFGAAAGLTQVRNCYATLSDSVAMPLMRMLDAEQAHNVAVKAASLGLAPKVRVSQTTSFRH